MAEITLVTDGLRFRGWSDLSVSRSMDSLSGAFGFALRNKANQFAIGPGLPVSVQIDGNPLMTGYIETRNRRVTANTLEFGIGGREKTCDIIDCSAVYKTGRWNTETKVEDIFKALSAPYGIDAYDVTGTNATMKRFSLDDGETNFSAMNRICRAKKLIMLTDVDGNIVITSPGAKIASDKLELGVNVFDHEDNIDYTDRFSTYDIKTEVDSGESIDYLGNDQKVRQWTTYARGHAEDPVIKTWLGRHRNIILHPEYQASNAVAKTTAEWEAKIRAARSTSITVKVNGWYQKGGKELWGVNMLVHYVNDVFNIDDTFIIAEIEYSYSIQAGTVCTMKLRNKNAYSPEPLAPAKPKSKKETTMNWLDNVQKPVTTDTIISPEPIE